jgi:hypothetical protein
MMSIISDKYKSDSNFEGVNKSKSLYTRFPLYEGVQVETT